MDSFCWCFFFGGGQDLAHLELYDDDALNSLGREILRRRFVLVVRLTGSWGFAPQNVVVF